MDKLAPDMDNASALYRAMLTEAAIVGGIRYEVRGTGIHLVGMVEYRPDVLESDVFYMVVPNLNPSGNRPENFAMAFKFRHIREIKASRCEGGIKMVIWV